MVDVYNLLLCLVRTRKVDDADDDEKNQSAEHGVVFCLRRHPRGVQSATRPVPELINSH